MREEEIINESSLSRVWRHFNQPDTSVAILTAFRGRDAGDVALSDEELYQRNVDRNKSLVDKLKDRGYGYIHVDGHWVENEGTTDERLVKEDSVFVAVKNAESDFTEFIHKLGNKYNQDAVLVKDDAGTRLITKSGDEITLGELRPGKLSDVYTKLRNNKRSNTFVFENERDDLGWVIRLIASERLRSLGYRGI